MYSASNTLGRTAVYSTFARRLSSAAAAEGGGGVGKTAAILLGVVGVGSGITWGTGLFSTTNPAGAAKRVADAAISHDGAKDSMRAKVAAAAGRPTHGQRCKIRSKVVSPLPVANLSR